MWDKGARDKIIWLCAVQIARDNEVDDRERFNGQIWKQQWDQKHDNIKIINPTVRISYNMKSRIQGMRQHRNIIGKGSC